MKRLIKRTGIVLATIACLALTLIPATSSAANDWGVPAERTLTITDTSEWWGAADIKGTVIFSMGSCLYTLPHKDNYLSLSGQFIIENGGTFQNIGDFTNKGLITVKKGGLLKNNGFDTLTNSNVDGTICNNGTIIIEHGAIFERGNIVGNGVIYDLNDGKNIMPGTTGMKRYESTDGYSYVYLGNKTYDGGDLTGSAPKGSIKWRILDADKGNAINAVPDEADSLTHGSSDVNNDDAMFLLSEETFDETVFSATDSTWQSSIAKSLCQSLFNGTFDSQKTLFNQKEQNAILSTTKSDSRTGNSNQLNYILNNDRLFPLSADEALNSQYGFSTEASDDTSRVVTGKSWWLRTPATSTNFSSYLDFANTNGSLRMNPYSEKSDIRPALNLYKNDVLFSSKAEGGKTCGKLGPDSLTAVSDNDSKEWKLTLKDEDRNFKITSSAPSKTSATVTYSGAAPNSVTAPNEFISAIVKNEAGIITYYGRITKPSAASGQATINLPDDFNHSKDSLYVFSEQYNGDKMTDLASEPVEVSTRIIQDGGKPTPSDNPSSPDTSDRSNLPLFLALALLSALGVLTAYVKKSPLKKGRG